MIGLLALSWFFQPLHGNGYQFWSGIGSDVSELAILAAVIAFLRRNNCHVRGCWRLQWWAHPDHGHPVCRKHHPHEAPTE